MKIILTKNVDKIGQAGEIRDVSPGYARNFLIAKKLAIPATTKAIKHAKRRQEAIVDQRDTAKQDKTEIAQKLNSQHLKISVKVDDNDKLYGAVSAEHIAKAIKEQCDYDIKKDSIEIAEPIKLAGKYEIPLALGEENVIINIEIIGEGK